MVNDGKHCMNIDCMIEGYTYNSSGPFPASCPTFLRESKITDLQILAIESSDCASAVNFKESIVDLFGI